MSPTKRPFLVDDGHRIEVDVVAARVGQAIDHLGHGVVGDRHHEGGRHDAARFVLGIAEKLAQRRRRRRAPCGAATRLASSPADRGGRRPPHRAPWPTSRRAASSGSASRNNCSRSSGCISSSASAASSALSAASSSLPLVAAEVLQQVGQLAGAQAVQPFMGHLEADLGRPVDRVVRLPEGLDGGPVDDAVGRGRGAPAARPQAAEQGGRRHVCPDEADATEHFGQIEVGGPNDLHAVDVDQLVVEDVLGQEHLTRPPHDVTQVEPGRAQQHLGVGDAIDGRGGDEGQPAPHP